MSASLLPRPSTGVVEAPLGAGLVVFEGGTHFVFLEQWRRFVLIVKRFIMEDQA